MKIRIPRDAEYLKLCKITNEADYLMHWNIMACWVNDSGKPLSFSHTGYRASRGYYSSRIWNRTSTSYRGIYVGFRPAVEGLNTDALTPDKDGLVVLGTLYMDGKPLEVPKNPTKYGDIADYIPCTVLEMRGPLNDPDYQVKGFVVEDGVAIVDRVLLKNISYKDIEQASQKE